MNKNIIAVALTVFFSSPSYAVDVLSFKYNDDVTIKIANVACPLKDHKDKYPWGAVAERSDGQYLFGCFRKLNENDIEIQWAGGDISVFPANLFLVKPEPQQPKPAAKPKWTPPENAEPTL
jgi:hypothetical protein